MTGSGTSARSSRAALMGSRSPAASTTGARDAAMRPVMSGAPTAKAAGSKATVHPPSPSTIAASATASGATSPVSPASWRCRSAASRRVAYFGFGRVDSARARASSSSVQATLIPNPHTAETRTPNRPLARVSATTPPSEWPSATTRSAGGTAGATAAARRPKEYDASASEPPCPGRSGATHRPGHRSFRRSSNPRHTSPVAPSPCSSNNTGPPSPPCWTRNRSLIGRRGGPRHGPPHPPTLGRAPAKPWRASTSTQDRSSADVGGPDMAPHTPRPSDAPRPSRGAPRRRHRIAHRRDSMAPFLTRVASSALIPPPSDRLALGPGGSHGTPGELAGWESSGISQDGGGRGDGSRRRGRDSGHRRGAEGPELSEGDAAQRSGMGELRPGLRRRVQASRGRVREAGWGRGHRRPDQHERSESADPVAHRNAG